MGKRLAENHDEETTKPHKIRKTHQLHNHYGNDEKKTEDFVLTKEIADSTILIDLFLKSWRIGKPIGKGSFGEIFLASDNIDQPVTSENAKFVAKIEPYSNGPLFVEIHCLLKAGKDTEEDPLPPGMPRYVASGSHYFQNSRYRFLILPRYKTDLHSITKGRRMPPKSVLTIATQILDVLEHLHDKGYAHSDIKAENLMIGDSFYYGERPPIPDYKPDRERKSARLEDHEMSSPKRAVGARAKKLNSVQYSGSNPVRSCRRKGMGVTSTPVAVTQSADHTEIYDDMLKTHYLRPSKCVSYHEHDDDDTKSEYSDKNDREFLASPSKRSPPASAKKAQHVTRHQALAATTKISQPVPNGKVSKKLQREERIFLIDFGLASKFIDSAGAHRPFCMDQRRAHDGTLEFTSRDAHMGAHSRRSDLECLGYNLIFWSQGFLPWKEEKLMTQPEQVHRMKEYLMTDVREMLKNVYGPQVPKYLGDFLHYVGKLSYDERPDYRYCKSLFEREFLRLGFKRTAMHLSMVELKKRTTTAAEDQAELEQIEKKMKNIKTAMKLGLLLPFKEVSAFNGSGSTKLQNPSPKNLRSKIDKKSKRQKKKFSWAEILSTDPDQIARQRAEKEFEREENDETEEVPIRYTGQPTYAILEIENRLQAKADNSQLHNENSCSNAARIDDDCHIQGYTKPMMMVVRKMQGDLIAEFSETGGHNQFQLRKNSCNADLTVIQVSDDDGEDDEGDGQHAETENEQSDNDEAESEYEEESEEEQEEDDVDEVDETLVGENREEQTLTNEIEEDSEQEESEVEEQEEESEDEEEAEEQEEKELPSLPPPKVAIPQTPQPFHANIKIRIQRNKHGLRSVLKPTRKSLIYKSNIERRNYRRSTANPKSHDQKQQQQQQQQQQISSYDTPPTTDESSCSSTNTNSSSAYGNGKTYFRQRPTQRRRVKTTTKMNVVQTSRSSSRSTAGSDSAASSLATRSRTTSTSSSLRSSASMYSDDSRDSEYRPIKTRFKRKVSKKSPLAPPASRRRADNRIAKKRVYMVRNVRTNSRG